MRRREFLCGLSGAALAWPLAARAQQSGKMPIVGFMGQSTPAANGPRAVASVQRLRELGWIEGRNIAFEYRYAEGRAERLAEIAAELVRLKADIIFTLGGTPSVLAAKKTTSTVPIVFIAAGDPVGTGLVASLARPGGNVTGLSNQTKDIVSKRIGLLRESVPDLRRLAIMTNVDNISAASEKREALAVAGALGLQVVALDLRRADDIAAAFQTLKERADALYVVIDPLVLTHATRVNTLALGARLPTMHGGREFIVTGGLLSYGVNVPDLARRAGDYVDKILRGAKPADIPVEQPTKFDFLVNLTQRRRSASPCRFRCSAAPTR